MIPREEWLSIIETYSARIWPTQVVFYLAVILLCGWLLLRPSRIQSEFTKLYLSAAFLWNGIAFYLVFGRDIAGGSYGNYFFASIFIIISLLFAVDLVRQKMQFSLPPTGCRRYATLSFMLLVLCYPLFGIAFGHPLSRLIIPGAFPCPTTALGLLLLATALPQVDKIIYVLLLFCAIPFTPFVQILKYGVYEDTILFAIGIYSLVLLLKSWKAESKPCETDG